MNDNYLIVMLGGIASQMFQQWRGFKEVERKIENNYVPVSVYRDKVNDLHAEINSLKLQVARLEERQK